MSSIEREACERVFTCDKRPANEIPVSCDGFALFPGTRFFCLTRIGDGVRLTVVTIVRLVLDVRDRKPTTVPYAESAAHDGAIGANSFEVMPGNLFFIRENAEREMIASLPAADVGNVAPFAHWKRRDAAKGAS